MQPTLARNIPADANKYLCRLRATQRRTLCRTGRSARCPKLQLINFTNGLIRETLALEDQRYLLRD